MFYAHTKHYSAKTTIIVLLLVVSTLISIYMPIYFATLPVGGM